MLTQNGKYGEGYAYAFERRAEARLRAMTCALVAFLRIPRVVWGSRCA
jgi:hypothetical protein